MGYWLGEGHQQWTWYASHDRREVLNQSDSGNVTLYRRVNKETRTRQTQYNPVGLRPRSVSLVDKVSVIRDYDGKVEIDTGCRRRIIPPRVRFAN